MNDKFPGSGIYLTLLKKVGLKRYSSDVLRTLVTAISLQIQPLWVGTDLELFRLVSQDNGWKIANEFNVHNSGLGANRVNAISISMDDSGETKLWVGTPCGLSCYTY